MPWLGFEPQLPALQTSTLAKNYLDSLHIWLFWCASWLSQCIKGTLTCSDMLFTSLTHTFWHQMIASHSPLNNQALAVHVFWSHLGHHYGGTWPRFSPVSIRACETDMFWLGFEPRLPAPKEGTPSSHLPHRIWLFWSATSGWNPKGAKGGEREKKRHAGIQGFEIRIQLMWLERRQFV
jgi:hypothetical protein